MVPLYVILMLGYGSIKWWKIFTPEECDAVNRLFYYFILPLFIFEFTAHVDPFKMNNKFIGADAISKVIIVVVFAFWAKYSSKGSYCWSITSFSLSTLTNSLVVGVPLLKAIPKGKHNHYDDFGDCVYADEFVVHFERIDVGGELKGEEGKGEVVDKAVYGIALFRGEDLPPLY
ncbi:hypothetical protein ACSBR2_006971 [Camellia fascicularis]